MPTQIEIEAAAKALWEEASHREWGAWEQCGGKWQDAWRKSAKAALEAAERARWQPIAKRPDQDDPMWFAKFDGRNWIVDGPRGAEHDDADRYDYWTECDAPPLPSPPEST